MTTRARSISWDCPYHEVKWQRFRFPVMSREARARNGSFLMVRPESPTLSPAIFQRWVVERPQGSPSSARKVRGMSPIPSRFHSTCRLASGNSVAPFMNRMAVLRKVETRVNLQANQTENFRSTELGKGECNFKGSTPRHTVGTNSLLAPWIKCCGTVTIFYRSGSEWIFFSSLKGCNFCSGRNFIILKAS